MLWIFNCINILGHQILRLNLSHWDVQALICRLRSEWLILFNKWITRPLDFDSETIFPSVGQVSIKKIFFFPCKYLIQQLHWLGYMSCVILVILVNSFGLFFIPLYKRLCHIRCSSMFLPHLKYCDLHRPNLCVERSGLSWQLTWLKRTQAKDCSNFSYFEYQRSACLTHSDSSTGYEPSISLRLWKSKANGLHLHVLWSLAERGRYKTSAYPKVCIWFTQSTERVWERCISTITNRQLKLEFLDVKECFF